MQPIDSPVTQPQLNMDDNQLDEKAVATVMTEIPEAQKVRVTSTTQPFLGGALATVSYRTKDDVDHDHYVYLTDDKRPQILWDMQEMGRVASLWEQGNGKTPPQGIGRLIINNVPGVIALCMTAAVIFAALTGDKKVDETLKLGLGSVLAFFFGTRIGNTNDNSRNG